MSFDIFLVHFENGHVSEVQRQPVRAVLQRTLYHGPDKFGFYRVSFPDRTDVEFSAHGLESDESFTSCAFHIRAFGEALMTFLFEVACAGDMVMMPAMEGYPLILVSESQRAHVPAEVVEALRPVVVQSPAELSALLSGGFAGWSAYRDRVVRRNEGV
jgi:hypothetical protein